MQEVNGASIPLTPSLADNLRLALPSPTVPEAVSRASGLTLGALFETACLANDPRRSETDRALVEAIGTRWPILRDVIHFVAADRDPEPEALFASPALELFALRNRDSYLTEDWTFYRQRLVRSMVGSGFAKKLAYALSRALAEMADNVVQHSGPDDLHPAPGVVGYHVGPSAMTFCVVDQGRGTLASLRTNPRWQQLADSRTAICEAVLNSATRRIGVAKGLGFTEVQKAIADVNGNLRFRSGDGVLLLDGRGMRRKARAMSAPWLSGMQVTVACSAKGALRRELVL